MRKIIKYFAFMLAGIMLMSMYSCETNDIVKTYDDPAAHYQINNAGTTGNYFVQEVGDQGYTITVGLVTVLDADKVIAFTTSGSATDGEQYTLSSTNIIIPAGSTTGTLTISGIYAGFTGQIDDLVITLNEGTGLYGNTEFTLSMQRYCTFDINDFVGTWNVDDFSDYDGAYPTYQVTTAIHEGNTLVVSNLWESTPPVYITLNADDPANFTATIADQFYDTHSSYGEMRIAEMSGGSFSSCDMVINTSYRIYVSVGHFDKVSSSVWTLVTP